MMTENEIKAALALILQSCATFRLSVVVEITFQQFFELCSPWSQDANPTVKMGFLTCQCCTVSGYRFSDISISGFVGYFLLPLAGGL